MVGQTEGQNDETDPIVFLSALTQGLNVKSNSFFSEIYILYLINFFSEIYISF